MSLQTNNDVGEQAGTGMNYWWKNLIVTAKTVYNGLGLKIFRNNRTFMTKSNKELLKVVFYRQGVWHSPFIIT